MLAGGTCIREFLREGGDLGAAKFPSEKEKPGDKVAAAPIIAVGNLISNASGYQKRGV